MTHAQSFESLVIVVLAAFITPILLNRFRLHFIPVVVAEIIAGIIIGKTGFDIIDAGSFLDTLSTLGFIYLLFLSGVEIDFSVFAQNKKKDKKKQEPNGPILALLIFTSILLLSYVISLGIVWLGFSNNEYILTLVISTISLGIVVPTLKDSGILKSSVGQNILLITVVGDLATMILLAVFVSVSGGASGSTWLLLILFAAGVLLYLLGKFFKSRSFMETMTRGTIQIDIRAVFTLIIVLVGLASQLGTEIILGSFLAGVLVSLLSPNPTMVQKLDSFGYGFLIPIFFVMIGVDLNLRSLLTDPEVLMLIPLLFVAFVVAKLIPSLILRKWYDWKTVLSIGSLISAKLTLVIAAARIAEQMGMIATKTASAIILVGVLSCIMGPIVFKKLFPFASDDAKQSVAFIGANQITLPLSLELDNEDYETFMYHKKQGKKEDSFAQSQDQKFAITELPDYNVKTLDGLKVFDADILVFATGDSHTNAELACAAKERGVERVIARIERPDTRKDLKEQNIDTFATMLSTKTILKAMVESPNIIDILTKEDTGLYEVPMQNPKYEHTELREFPFLGDAIIVRIFRGNDSIIPHGDTQLHMDDHLVVSGSKEHVEKLKRMLCTQ
ncbi:cation:proton antiporter family protein [Tuberibacillus sp. Marseille-P3662]|uniref:cation:proton antiporter family protein n=1 Tax=Tuberibacillus sp. Marseille-P3662 TaxID=1965358 RepID=UPI000A1CA6FA|nr:cation:proton antiporter family protein [Tuberibacillus sp. Marseille-P3662]